MFKQTSETGCSREISIKILLKLKIFYCFKLSFVVCSLLVSLLFIPMFGGSALSQSLDDAVSRQLGPGPSLIRVCYELLDDGTIPPGAVLEGPLREICMRTIPSPGAGPSESTGGGAATPNTLPSILQQYLREARGEEKEPTATGASADMTDEFVSGMGFFFSVSSGDLDRDLTDFEEGYDSDIWRITAGLDFQVSSSFAAGIAFDYYQHDGQYNGGGGFENDNLGVWVFGSILPIDNFFLQLYGGFALTEYDRNRFAAFTEPREIAGRDRPTTVASGIIKASYDGNNIGAGGLAGYQIGIKNFAISPRLGIDWVQRNFDKYSENGDTGLELRFEEDEQKLLQSRVGLLASVAFKTAFGSVVPQASFDWKHEFENDQRHVDVSFVGDTRPKKFTFETEPPDRNWYEINAGIVAVFPYSIQAFGNYQLLAGHDYYDGYAVTLGLRADF